jgi:hypothetical protein
VAHLFPRCTSVIFIVCTAIIRAGPRSSPGRWDGYEPLLELYKSHLLPCNPTPTLVSFTAPPPSSFLPRSCSLPQASTRASLCFLVSKDTNATAAPPPCHRLLRPCASAPFADLAALLQRQAACLRASAARLHHRFLLVSLPFAILSPSSPWSSGRASVSHLTHVCFPLTRAPDLSALVTMVFASVRGIPGSARPCTPSSSSRPRVRARCRPAARQRSDPARRPPLRPSRQGLHPSSTVPAAGRKHMPPSSASFPSASMSV